MEEIITSLLWKGAYSCLQRVSPSPKSPNDTKQAESGGLPNVKYLFLCFPVFTIWTGFCELSLVPHVLTCKTVELDYISFCTSFPWEVTAAQTAPHGDCQSSPIPNGSSSSNPRLPPGLRWAHRSVWHLTESITCLLFSLLLRATPSFPIFLIFFSSLTFHPPARP